MAKVNRPDGSLVSGKLSKKSKKVHRIRNGAETTYEMEYYSGPASKAQKAARSLHAKICAVLNPLMSDPEPSQGARGANEGIQQPASV